MQTLAPHTTRTDTTQFTTPVYQDTEDSSMSRVCLTVTLVATIAFAVLGGYFAAGALLAGELLDTVLPLAVITISIILGYIVSKNLSPSSSSIDLKDRSITDQSNPPPSLQDKFDAFMQSAIPEIDPGLSSDNYNELFHQLTESKEIINVFQQLLQDEYQNVKGSFSRFDQDEFFRFVESMYRQLQSIEPPKEENLHSLLFGALEHLFFNELVRLGGAEYAEDGTLYPADNIVELELDPEARLTVADVSRDYLDPNEMTERGCQPEVAATYHAPSTQPVESARGATFTPAAEADRDPSIAQSAPMPQSSRKHQIQDTPNLDRTFSHPNSAKATQYFRNCIDIVITHQRENWVATFPPTPEEFGSFQGNHYHSPVRNPPSFSSSISLSQVPGTPSANRSGISNPSTAKKSPPRTPFALLQPPSHVQRADALKPSFGPTRRATGSENHEIYV